jgi:aryl-alcohol dehydrogenase-like predicted oxidoreductase
MNEALRIVRTVRTVRIVHIGGELPVRRLGFGAMRLCGPLVMGWPADRERALAVLRRAIELGVNFIDTADAYGPHINELQIAEALYPYPPGLVIATKGGLLRDEPPAFRRDGRPEHLRAACEGSLTRLRLAQIDLYQLHAVDPNVPIEESVGELARLREEGKIRHVGISNVSVGELERARKIVPVAAVQNRYNYHDRASEDVLRACERYGIAFLPWSPLARGSLARPDRAIHDATNGEADPVRVPDHVHVTGGAERAHGASPAQAAIAWLLQRSPVMLPIPGTSSIEHLEENVAAARILLSDA